MFLCIALFHSTPTLGSGLIVVTQVCIHWSYVLNSFYYKVFVTYKGYELIGQSKVHCGRNGRWVGEFPTCAKKKLCEINGLTSNDIKVKYENLLTRNPKPVAGFDS